MNVFFMRLSLSVASTLVLLSGSGLVLAQSSGPAQVEPSTAAPAQGPALDVPAPAGQKLDLLGDRKPAPVSRASTDQRAKPLPLVRLPSLGLCDGS